MELQKHKNRRKETYRNFSTKGEMGRTRRTFTAEEKLKVVMAVIQDGKAVSHVAYEVIAETAEEKRLADRREKLHNADI